MAVDIKTPGSHDFLLFQSADPFLEKGSSDISGEVHQLFDWQEQSACPLVVLIPVYTRIACTSLSSR